MIRIEHSHETGTLVEGTAKGDGTAAHLKASGFRWSGRLGAWYLPHTRDRDAREYTLEQAAAALREAGHQVMVSINDTARCVEEIEADKAQRAEARASRRRAMAEKAGQRAENAYGAARQIADGIPFGQPILVGHHSQRRAERDAERIRQNMRRTVAESAKADYHQRRAEAAAGERDRRYNPVTVANRIETLSAELRKTERALTGHTRTLFTYRDGTRAVEETAPASGAYAERLQRRRNELTRQIDYWQQVRADQIANGEATSYSRDTISKGDRVLIRSTWAVVVRANPKTVTVQYAHVPFELKYTYAEIKDHKPSQ